jgi:hypothetical protein
MLKSLSESDCSQVFGSLMKAAENSSISAEIIADKQKKDHHFIFGRFIVKNLTLK